MLMNFPQLRPHILWKLVVEFTAFLRTSYSLRAPRRERCFTRC